MQYISDTLRHSLKLGIPCRWRFRQLHGYVDALSGLPYSFWWQLFTTWKQSWFCSSWVGNAHWLNSPLGLGGCLCPPVRTATPRLVCLPCSLCSQETLKSPAAAPGNALTTPTSLASLLTPGGFSTQVPQIPGTLCPTHSSVQSPELTVAAAGVAAYLTNFSYSQLIT